VGAATQGGPHGHTFQWPLGFAALAALSTLFLPAVR
jgi:hypothetical protein